MPVEPAEDRVRTFHARRGRRSRLTTTRLTHLLPRYAAPAWLLRGAPPPPGAGVVRPERVVLEVGCGHGGAALGYAASHPTHVVLAVDVHPPGVARMLAAADLAGLGNLFAELTDAVELLQRRVGEGALDAVHVFFPDPWPKTRHRRRRFVSEDTLTLLADRLTPGGEVLLATDDPGYAAHVRRVVAAYRGPGRFTATDAPRPPWRPVAGFEAKARAGGRAVHELRLTRGC